MSQFWLEPNFRPGMNVLDALTAERLNAVVKAINSSRPLGSDTVMVSPTSQGCIISTKSGPNAPHPFAIRVTKSESNWLLYVCPGTVYHTSSNNKRRFGFFIVDPETPAATEEVEIGVTQTWELYVKLKFKNDGEGQKQAFEEHLAGVGGKDCVRRLISAEFVWHRVPESDQDNDEKEGITKKDKSDTRYYYIGRVKFSDQAYSLDQRRRSDIDICDPCEDPESSSSSSSSSSDSSGDDGPGDGVYVVTDVNCSMEPTSGGGCCVTLTLSKRWMNVVPGDEETETKNCCEGD